MAGEGGAELRAAILRRFKDVLGSRGVDVEEAEGSSNYVLDLSRDLRGYAIGPHTDDPFKLVSTLYYLPHHDRPQPKYGTQVVSSGAGKTQGKSQWLDMDDPEGR